jgi:hypothetical protein
MFVNLPFTLAFPLILNTLQNMGAVQLEQEHNLQRGIIFARMAPGPHSAGEDLLVLAEEKSTRTAVRIASKSSTPGALADFGKNQQNVDRFEALLNDRVLNVQKSTNDWETSAAKKQNAQPRPISPQKPSNHSPYQVLDVAPGANQDEITSAYRHKVKKYHPDRLAGLPVEFRSIADDWMKVINAAYEELIHKSS